MTIGIIRPVEVRTVELQGDSLADVHAQAEAATPAGWELTVVRVAMTMGTTRLTAVASIARRDGTREIEAESTERLRAIVPEGYELIAVRAA